MDTDQAFCWAELPAEDVLARLRSRGPGATSGFLDTHQWAPLAGRPGITLAGGHPAAQYRRAALDTPEIGWRAFAVNHDDLPEHGRSPRQLRGWLYRQGLPDSSLGDIIAGADWTLVTTEPDIELLEIGLKARLLNGWDAPAVEAKRTTAAGTRIDAVLTSLFRVSRGEAQTALKYGFVYLNFRTVEKRTTAVQVGDQIVYRTKGRAEVTGLEVNQRSGRVWVESRYYPG